MRLIADIGGTNARFALSTGAGDVGPARVLPVSAHPSFEDALATFLSTSGSQVADAAVAAAGPVIDGRIAMTNADWTIDARAFRAAGITGPIRILNDLAAVGHALPVLGPGDLATLLPAPNSEDPKIAVNVGTGFGAAVSVPHGVLSTEAGHMTLAIRGDEEQRYFGAAQTVEDILSGPALQRLRKSYADEERFVPAFSRLLGRVTGDLVLATGSWGGAYLCGGVLSDLDSTIDRAALIDGFARRTGVAARLARVPLHHIIHPASALLGLSNL